MVNLKRNRNFNKGKVVKYNFGKIWYELTENLHVVTLLCDVIEHISEICMDMITIPRNQDS
jgi:hypothetical protein